MYQFQPGQFTAEYETPEGQRLWELLNREEVVARMETASDLGQPALAPLEDILLGELGSVMLQDRFKQMAGRMTRQVMERHGFVHDSSDVRLNSVPFYKASRYRRRDETGLYLFKSSKDPKEICLTDTRKGEKMAQLSDGAHWIFVNYISSSLKASIGYGFDLKKAVIEVRQHGYILHRMSRIMKVLPRIRNSEYPRQQGFSRR
jgi:hypothetical protein